MADVSGCIDGCRYTLVLVWRLSLDGSTPLPWCGYRLVVYWWVMYTLVFGVADASGCMVGGTPWCWCG